MWDLCGINYLHSGQGVKDLTTSTVSAKVFQHDVLSSAFAAVIAKRKDAFKPTDGRLYGMLRVDMPFGLNQHEREYNIDYVCLI
jgi:hypothetical protein